MSICFVESYSSEPVDLAFVLILSINLCAISLMSEPTASYSQLMSFGWKFLKKPLPVCGSNLGSNCLLSWSIPTTKRLVMYLESSVLKARSFNQNLLLFCCYN
ncbi:unnamed protein product [Moneuplotes crassus]|uniref:Uncharacterized protein n=1 Tax=Euplotes crassus TaxID=5936 RepID=A0AAD1Y630_EUPCR|nr:unnamed protein product [Moneuplotes crassus]